MLAPISLKWRIGGAFAWMAMCHFYMVQVYQDAVTFVAAMSGAIVFLAWGRVHVVFNLIISAMGSMFSEPQGKTATDEMRVIFGNAGLNYDKVKHKLHNWWSRYTAIGLMLCTVTGMLLTEGVLEFWIAVIGAGMAVSVLIWPKVDQAIGGKAGDEVAG